MNISLLRHRIHLVNDSQDFYGSSDEGKEYWAKTQATRAFVILSILVSAAGVGVTFIGQAVPGAAAFGVAALCGLISTAVFAGMLLLSF